MKGAVFIALNDFIEEGFGIEVWESILNEARPASGGVYTSVQNYDDSELVDIVHAVCRQLKIDKGQALRIFGDYLFATLNRKHPIFTSLQPDLFKFLASVEGVVHVEVEKLFTGVQLPTMKAIEKSDDCVVLHYESARKMCELAEGLIQGAAKYYGVEVELTQRCCYHSGDDHCEIEVRKIG